MTFKPTVEHPYNEELYSRESRSDRLSRSSQCSECSGAIKKGMEYICVCCLNKEMAKDKRQHLEYEREKANRYDLVQREKLEEEQAKQRERLEDLKKQMRRDLESQTLKSAEKKRLEEIER